MNLTQSNKLLGFAFLFLASTSPAQAEVQPVPFVELSRYLGTWYEIAAIPQDFQKQCISNTQAKYSEAGNNTIKVLNTCTKADGATSYAEGRAQVVDATSNAKLKVTFVSIFGNWIYLFGGKYWIIDLHPDYEYAVVGHPNRTKPTLHFLQSLSHDDTVTVGKEDQSIRSGFNVLHIVKA